MQSLWITEDDWLCFLFASGIQPKSPSCSKLVEVSDELAERILANQRETAAIQTLLYNLIPNPTHIDLLEQLPQEAYEQAQDEALVRFGKLNTTNLNNPLVRAYWNEVQVKPHIYQGEDDGQCDL